MNENENLVSTIRSVTLDSSLNPAAAKTPCPRSGRFERPHRP